MSVNHVTTMEPLEDRRLFANYAAATVTDLIAAINASNASAEVDTIILAAGATFTLTSVDNTDDDGPNGLPGITPESGGLTILGNGATIERSAAAGTAAFRLFRVHFDASLTLKDLTLQGGLATAPGRNARGGAIYADGTIGAGPVLNLDNVIVQNNSAVGADGRVVASFPVSAKDAEGGGIYAWSFRAVGCTIRNNLAQGGRGADLGAIAAAGYGQDATGGGIFGDGSMTDCVITGNTARGGEAGSGGGVGGWAIGGGAYLYGGTLRGVAITRNAAIAGNGTTRKAAGTAFGGGLYSALGTVELDVFTVRNTKQNTASDGLKNIAGDYVKIT